MTEVDRQVKKSWQEFGMELNRMKDVNNRKFWNTIKKFKRNKKKPLHYYQRNGGLRGI